MLVINDLRGVVQGNGWVSPARLCLTADGRVTTEDDPAAVSLLVAKGGSLTLSEARRYGLLQEETVDEPEAKEIKQPVNKSRKRLETK